MDRGQLQTASQIQVRPCYVNNVGGMLPMWRDTCAPRMQALIPPACTKYVTWAYADGTLRVVRVEPPKVCACTHAPGRAVRY